jgi:hypothetical protein
MDIYIGEVEPCIPSIPPVVFAKVVIYLYDMRIVASSDRDVRRRRPAIPGGRKTKEGDPAVPGPNGKIWRNPCVALSC